MTGKLAIQWLGHGTFLLTSPGGKRVLFDPWLEANPSCPDDCKSIGKADVILVTHGHPDHVSDVVSVARSTNAPVVAIHELGLWLRKQGLQQVHGMNKGVRSPLPASTSRW